ncbi:hypothetical protein C8E03_102396 [Lachnotalea glycerini]|uniref:Uncharacterized protein n=1 Tax=Lachnotalea glycerini TaxID=1763509 RepID=A0A318EQ65_9FIRM|nr:hypothetical protein [Lachnotalea glycerini]OYO51109.1 hypothetical protein CG709_20080 [Lachnotalea glycerini]PXV93625.1 hypothetical protein C8E03_102396 [Lachnotalea glycerini]
MMQINKGSKIGIILEAVAMMIGFVFVIRCWPIPDFVMWIFAGGGIIAITSALETMLRRTNYKE